MMTRSSILLIAAIVVAASSWSQSYVISPDVLNKILDANPEILKSRIAQLKKNDARQSVCTTSQCVVSAAEIITNMDLTADPCEDFYQFSCGNWVKKHPIPESKSRWTQFDIMRDELDAIVKGILEEENSKDDPQPVSASRDMYAACMDTASIESLGLKPLTDLLDGFGGWPMTVNDWKESSFDWRKATATARKLYGVTYLLNIYNALDTKNTETSAIYVDQGSLPLPRSTLVEPENSATIIEAYSNYAIGAAKAIRDSLKTKATDAQIAEEVAAMVKFESELAGITTSAEDRRNNTRMYNPLLVSEVQDWTDSVGAKNPNAQIDWSAYVSDIYSLANLEIPPTERVIVVETEFLKKLVTLLDQTEPRVLANYIHWRLVNSLASDTTQQMIDLSFEFSKVLYGTTQPTKRTSTCVGKVNNLLGYAVGAKYVEKAFDDAGKTEVEELISNLKTAFKSLVDDASWMDSATKKIAREKADAIREFIAYPDWSQNKTALEDYYKGLQVQKGQHFQNIQNVNSLLIQDDFETLRGPTDRTKWISPPSIVNAFYAPEYNSITFPAGILQSPYFVSGRIAALNYGAIGVVIGHEITHGFDDQGRQSDKDGNTASWWTEDTLAKYLTRSQCFIDQYTNFTVPSGSHVNGINTQGENIADNGGVRESFRAYSYYVAANGGEQLLPGLEQFTPEQLFFISYANVWCGTETPAGLENQLLTDPHSPGRFRVIGPLSNSDDFVKQFSCPAGSPMNRVDKCILW